jgi:hypothetical protein
MTAGCSSGPRFAIGGEEERVEQRRARAWAGVDAGKGHHWMSVVDESGASVFSRKVDNDETAILTAISDVLVLAGRVQWVVDIAGTASALLLALLAAQGQQPGG